jgi:hypothetical protein
MGDRDMKNIEIFDLFEVYWDKTTQKGHSIFGAYTLMHHPDYQDRANIHFSGVCSRSPYQNDGEIILGTRIKYSDIEQIVREHHQHNIEWNKKRLLNFFSNIKPVEPKRQLLINDIQKLKDIKDSMESSDVWALNMQIRELEQKLVRLA